MRKIIEYKDQNEWHQLRASVLTSTDIAALFELSPYLTVSELWHRKKDNVIPEFQSSERMNWGSRLEQAIAEGVALDKGWEIQPKKHFILDDELKIGSSFDYEIVKPEQALLEIKNVDLMQFQKWSGQDETLEAPAHIEMQLQYQMLVSGVAEGYIAALIGGNQIQLIKREIDEDIANAIKQKVFEFWESIKKNEAPRFDFKRDADFIATLYKNVRTGSEIKSVSGDRISQLAAAYKTFGDQEKAAKECKESAKAELLTLIGDAEKVKGDEFSISAGIVKGGPVSYTREDYRNFRVNFKKTKENL